VRATRALAATLRHDTKRESAAIQVYVSSCPLYSAPAVVHFRYFYSLLQCGARIRFTRTRLRKKTMAIARILLLAFVCAIAASVHAEPGVTDSTITLGMSSPFSGPNAAYGMEMKEVINAYLQQINQNGGINGRKLELIALDDGYETERTVANTKKLINDNKVFALLGYYGSSPTTAAMEVFSASRVPLVGTISGADTLRTPVNRFMFHVRASYADETEAIITQLESLGIRKIAVFYQNDGFGKSGFDGATNALKKYNLKPVAAATIERNSLDVNAAVETIAKADPQAVVMVTLYKPTALFVKQMHKVGQHPQLITLSPVGADLLVKELGSEARGIGISQVMPYPWNKAMPVVKEYQRLLLQQTKRENYSYYGIEAYVTTKVLVDAIERVGRNLTREKLVSTLEAMSSLDLGGYSVNYSPLSHNGSKFVDLTVIGNNGRVLH
jgi:branched-chain amino acid transport system substrate-binding protein